jgi:16S rRNA C1402 (ribose-2'-O) methylase RsmI
MLIEKLLEGKNIAVVSDAGTPGISDPGEEIVKEAIENGIEIVPIPRLCSVCKCFNWFWNEYKRIYFCWIFVCK